MAHGTSVSIDQAAEQTPGAAVSLLAAGAGIRQMLAEQLHDAKLTASVPDVLAKFAVLAAISLAGHAAQLNALALLEDR